MNSSEIEIEIDLKLRQLLLKSFLEAQQSVRITKTLKFPDTFVCNQNRLIQTNLGTMSGGHCSFYK